jgi:predicted CXXCH cytochrome family protein
MAEPSVTPAQKTCRECGETKPVEAFSTCGGKKHPHLRRGDCKTCHAKHEATKRRLYPEKYRAFEQKRMEQHGEKRRAASRAYNARTYPLRREQECAKRRPKDRAKYAADPEKYREKNRRYQKTHIEIWILSQAKRRARKKGLPDTFTHAERQFMYQYFGYACAACGKQEGLLWRLAEDHWIPISSPVCPGTIATNMVLLCDRGGGCNTSKRNRNPQEWVIDRFGTRKARAILRKIKAYFAAVSARFS